MLLPVQITFRNLENPKGLESYVQAEAAKLERFFNRISSCRVMVERPQRAASGKLHHVRIDVGVPNEELVVKHAPTLHGTQQDLKEAKSKREAKSVLVHKDPKRAIHEAFEEMGRQLQDYVRRQGGAVKAKEGMQEGVVHEIFPDRGYGFLETQDGRSIYFNEASVLNGGFVRLRAGTKVGFDEEMGEQGPQASTVRILHPRSQARSAALSGVLSPKAARARATLPRTAIS